MERVPEALDPLVFAFAGLGGLLAVRATSRAARRRAAATRRALWAPLSAADAGARAIRLAATPACAALLVTVFGLAATDSAGCRALAWVCARGHLATAAWLAEYFAPTRATTVLFSLSDACRQGHTAVARWLITKFGSTARRWATIKVYFQSACDGGRLTTVRWLAHRFVAAIANKQGFCARGAWRGACQNGHSAMLRWVAQYFAFDRNHPTYGFLKLCRFGRLQDAKWYLTTYYCCIDGAYTSVIERALLKACCRGHLGVSRWLVRFKQVDAAKTLWVAIAQRNLTTARWLAARFALAWRRNGRAFPFVAEAGKFAPGFACRPILNAGKVLRRVCCAGDLAMARWGVDRFAATAADIVAPRGGGDPDGDPDSDPDGDRNGGHDVLLTACQDVLSTVCQGADLPMARWLATRFALDARGAGRVMRGVRRRALVLACAEGHLATARWLAARFPHAAAPHHRAAALHGACVWEQLTVAQWLATRFIIADARRDGDRVFIDTCARGHLEVAKWFAARFGLTAANAGRAARAALRKLNRAEPWTYPLVQWLMEHFALGDAH